MTRSGGGWRDPLMARAAVTVAVLIAAAALVVQGSFRRASPLETPSSLLAHRGLWGSPVRLVGGTDVDSKELGWLGSSSA